MSEIIDVIQGLIDSDKAMLDLMERIVDDSVDTKPGVGIMLTLRGIKLMAWGSQEHSEIVKENFTNESIGEGKLHHFTNETKGGI